MILSHKSLPASAAQQALILRPEIHVPPAPAPEVIVDVRPEITVQPAAVNLPSLTAIPEHPKVWDLEVTERDELGLIKRVRATAIG